MKDDEEAKVRRLTQRGVRFTAMPRDGTRQLCRSALSWWEPPGPCFVWFARAAAKMLMASLAPLWAVGIYAGVSKQSYKEKRKKNSHVKMTGKEAHDVFVSK